MISFILNTQTRLIGRYKKHQKDCQMAGTVEMLEWGVTAEQDLISFGKDENVLETGKAVNGAKLNALKLLNNRLYRMRLQFQLRKGKRLSAR